MVKVLWAQQRTLIEWHVNRKNLKKVNQISTPTEVPGKQIVGRLEEVPLSVATDLVSVADRRA